MAKIWLKIWLKVKENGTNKKNQIGENCGERKKNPSANPALPKLMKLSQTVGELWPAQDFGISGDKYIMEKVRVFLNMTCLLVLIYAKTKHYQNISNNIQKNLA